MLRRNSRRVNPWDPRFLDSLTWLPPNQRVVIDRWARDYEALTREIDRRYESGETRGVEVLEIRAQVLLEKLDAAVSEIETIEHEASGPHGDDEPDDFQGERDDEDECGGGLSLEEELARLWQDWLDDSYRFDVNPHYDHKEGIFTRHQQFAKIARHIILDRLHKAGGEAASSDVTLPTDLAHFEDQFFHDAARDAHARREYLRARHRDASRGRFDPREIRHQIRKARARRPGGMGPDPRRPST